MYERREQAPGSRRAGNDTPDGTTENNAWNGPGPNAKQTSVRTRALVGRVLIVIVLALTALYVFSEHRIAANSGTVMEEASIRFGIYLISEGLRAYHDSTGTYPNTLEEVGLDEAGIEYVTNGSTYRLVAVEGPSSIVYVEGESPDRYESAFNVLEGGAVR